MYSATTLLFPLSLISIDILGNFAAPVSFSPSANNFLASAGLYANVEVGTCSVKSLSFNPFIPIPFGTRVFAAVPYPFNTFFTKPSLSIDIRRAFLIFTFASVLLLKLNNRYHTDPSLFETIFGLFLNPFACSAVIEVTSTSLLLNAFNAELLSGIILYTIFSTFTLGASQ